MMNDETKELWAYEILHFHGIDIYGNETKNNNYDTIRKIL